MERLRGHRNLFNADCNTYFYDPQLWQPEGGPYSVKAIRRYLETLAAGTVDTLLMNPNTQVAAYPSKVWPTDLDGYRRGDKDFFRGGWSYMGGNEEEIEQRCARAVKLFDLYLDLLEAGVDWLAETAAICRELGISPWLSIRMNDNHAAVGAQHSPFSGPLLKREELRLSGCDIHPAHPPSESRRVLNYELPAVRDHYFALIREVVNDYDYEGMELDWLRAPMCCEPVASPETVETMTAWTAEIRALTQARAKRTGRPFPLGLRVPGHLNMLKAIGLDVKEMVRRKLVDFIGFSTWYHASADMPFDRLRAELGDEVAIYGVVEAGLSGTQRIMSARRETLAGNAAGKLVFDIDGIEQFNFFTARDKADYSALRDLDKLDVLRGEPKLYSFARGNGGSSFNQVEQLPLTLPLDRRHPFRIAMCAEPKDRDLRLTLEVVIDRLEAPPHIGVSLNGTWPTFDAEATDTLLCPTNPGDTHSPEHQAFHFRLDVGLIVDGWNEIVIYNYPAPPQAAGRGAGRSICIQSIALFIEPALDIR